MTCVNNDDDRFYTQIFLEKALLEAQKIQQLSIA